MTKDVFEQTVTKIVEISKIFGAEKVIMFGSCLDDIEHANDIDIGVKGIPSRYFFEYCGKLSLASPMEVDVIDLESVRKHFAERINQKGKVVYER